jgi:endonuclease/exonuclease/phosphatase family metal-dependent hydrolase
MLSSVKKIFLFITLATFSISSSGNEIHFMTYNIASLPSVFGTQINGSFLKPNAERVNEITNVINQLNQYQDINTPNVIAFQETFDLGIRELLKQKLKTFYPYNSGESGQKFLNAGSGLMLFSQYPILEINFHAYKNMMAGEETLANKGFITAKLKYNDKYFVTVIITHLEAGGAIFKNEQSKIATTSARRGMQMSEIYSDIVTTANKAPQGYENLIYLRTFVMGDFNTTLNSERQQKAISTGLSENGFKEGQIKYPGQNALFTVLENTIPKNFIEVRALPTCKGKGKNVDYDLLKQATQENQYTGSTYIQDQLKQIKDKDVRPTRQQTEYRIIDGIFVTHDGVPGDLQTQIISLNEFSHYPHPMSDHLTLIGGFTFD